MFHRNPETGFTEFWTTARICEHLEKLNCDIVYGRKLYTDFPEPELLKNWDDTVYTSVKERYRDDEWIHRLDGRTGCIAVIKGKNRGPNTCFRFDIDGLPIKESTNGSHIPFKEGFHSDNNNMHACGHDGHITIGLGLAARLKEHAEKLNGTFYLMFQPAEEVILGGRIFSKLNLTKDINYFFPVHIGLTGNKKVLCSVSFLADKRYTVMFKGRCTHAGATPQEGRNALLAACNAVSSLYGISRHSGGCTRINIGEFRSGNASNIISDNAQFELDLRGETNEICDYLQEQALNIINGASQMYSVENRIIPVADSETAVNSPRLIPLVHDACIDAGIGKNDITDGILIPGSEDATFIMNEVIKNGGLATYVGVGSSIKGGHHNNEFDFDEDVLSDGVDILYNIAMKISEQAACT